MTTTVSVPRAGHDVGYFNAGRVGGCAGAMSYYARSGEPPGQWVGRSAEKLGLTGQVDPDVIQNLYMKNIGPDGEVLARTHKQDGVQDVAVARAVRAYQRKHPYASATELDEVRARERAKAGKTSVPYFDETVSMVKSASVVHMSYRIGAMLARADGDEQLAAVLDARADAIEGALMDAGRDAVHWLERNAAYTRTGYHSGSTGEWRDAAGGTRGRGLTAALFLHHLSRDGDPHLHVHIAIWNRVQRADGEDDKYRTLHSRALYRQRLGLAPVPDRFAEKRLRECGIPRIALVRTSIPDVRLSDLEDPARAPLVLAFRAEVASQVRPAEFSDLQGLVQGLSTGIQGELDKRERRDERADDRGIAGRALRLAPRPVFLAGRRELLAELDARLAGDYGAGPSVVALTGLGGAGKTSVALEYAHRHLGEAGVAWQFPAEDRSVLAAGFGELAAQLGTPERGDPVATVHAVLAASAARWLLVFDNAPDRASVAPFVPPAGPGRVLITSRNQIWPPGQALEVPVLDPEVAAEFLVGRTGDPDRRAALDLAGELGGLPLALEQAAAYIQASGESLAGYLASFRQRRADMLGRGEPIGYSQTVAATWRLAFEDLQHAAPGAVGLLRLLAFCAAEAVPLRLLLQPRPGLAGRLGEEVAPVLVPLLQDRLAADDAIAALRRYSLVTLAADGSVLVHRLVQNVMLDQMPAGPAGKWRQAAAALIEAAIPADTGLPGTWPVCVALLPHVKAALAYDSAGMARIANYLGSSGSYAAARDLYREILDAGKDSREPVLGPEDRDFIRAARFELGRWTRNAGDAAAAKEQFDALLPEFERDLGPEHPDTLKTRGWLADLTGDMGDPGTARDLFAELVPVDERVLGPEHEETLAACRNLATWTGEAGDPAAAPDQYAIRLPVEKRVLGPKHQTTLITCANHARWTGEAGDPAAARDLLAALLPAFQDVFGPEHPRTLIVRHQLARWTGQAGDPATARDLLAALLPVFRDVFGPEHPRTLVVRHQLARWTGQAGDPAAARDQYAALLPVRERIHGQEHPHTLATRAGIAHWTGQAGDAAAARNQYAALVSVREHVLGPEHPDTLTARYELARWTGQAGDPAAARDQYAALLPVRERILGPDHPGTLAARRQHAHWSKEAGDPSTALL